MPAPGRCRCRCRPASAAPQSISTSSASSCRAATRACCLFPAETRPRCAREAARARGVSSAWTGRSSLAARRDRDPRLPRKPAPSDIAYLQYSSGSTRFPHGVVITHHALLNNLAAHSHGMHVVETDRCVSWLPWYHDMGLVGCLLVGRRQPGLDRLSQDRGFRAAPAGLARPDHAATRARRLSLFADLRLRHLRAPHVEPDQAPRALRPVALARRRQRRRHDPSRRDADRSSTPSPMPASRPRAFLPSYGLGRGDAGRLDHAAGRRHRRRAGRGNPALGRRRRPGIARSAIRAIVNCGKPARDMDDRDPRGRRHAACRDRRSARSGARPDA